MARRGWSADHHGFVPGDFDGDGRIEAVLQADGTKNPFVLRQDATSTRACTGNGCPWYDTYVWFAP